jgi:GTP-binding protein LepA
MLQALIFDSYYDKHRGVIAYLRLFNGELTPGTQMHFLATGAQAESQEVGYFHPLKLFPSKKLEVGEIGYVVTGLKDLNAVRVGDTVCDRANKDFILPGYKEVEPKVFSSIFPTDADDYPKLREAMGKLKLNDASLLYELENIPALGFGFRCGFLGLLHMDIVQERLSREFDLDLVLTTPSVEYIIKQIGEKEISIKNPSELPDPATLEYIKEPWIKLELITPEAYVGKIIEIITARRGMYEGINLLSGDQMQVTAKMPLAEMIVDFYDALKSATKGYATMSYELGEFIKDDLVKIDILVNKKVVDPMAFITHKSRADEQGKIICEKLKDLIPKQQFEIAIQAAIGARIIARETVKAFRKDVTAKLYGGDMSRRKKLLDKQKKGKKKMKMVGNVEIPQSAFLSVLKK